MSMILSRNNALYIHSRSLEIKRFFKTIENIVCSRRKFVLLCKLVLSFPSRELFHRAGASTPLRRTPFMVKYDQLICDTETKNVFNLADKHTLCTFLKLLATSVLRVITNGQQSCQLDITRPIQRHPDHGKKRRQRVLIYQLIYISAKLKNFLLYPIFNLLLTGPLLASCAIDYETYL